jgi:hypothetical protein
MTRTIAQAMHRLGLTLILIGIACHQGALRYGVVPASEGRYPADEAAAVYRAVLEKLYISSAESPPLVVIWDSATYSIPTCSERICPRIPPHVSVVNDETISDFEKATRLTAPLRADFGFVLPVKLLSEGDGDDLEALGRPGSDSLRKVNSYSESGPFWLGFRKRYPGAWGYAVLTRVGFDTRRRQALVQVKHQCSSSCDHTEDMFLEKVGGQWVVAERMLIGLRGRDWVDIVQRFNSPDGDGRDSVVFGSLRYLGPDAQYLKRVRLWNDSIRMVIRDSIARDLLPRRIRGTIRSRITGMPIPFAQVTAHVRPNDTKIRAVADSAGRYKFLDLPIGGTMLEVQCPGANSEPGKTLDAPGLYVRPAMDTVIDSTVPNIAPCWERIRLHPLSSGWVESKEAMNASTPGKDERDVYVEAIRAVRKLTRSPAIGSVFSHTTPRCRNSERCGSVHLARLERDGSVDPILGRDFIAKTENKVALKPDFARSLGLHVTTGAEVAYYADQAVRRSERYPDPRMDSALLFSALGKLNVKWKGVLSLSGIGFDAALTHALVELRVDTAVGSWGPSTMVLLKKTAGRWGVVINDVGKDATTGEWNGNQCVPVTALRSPTARDIAGLVGTYRVTFMQTVGRMGGDTVLIRLSYAFPDRSVYGKPIPPETRALSKPPHVFEIIDQSTGKVDDRGSLNFWIRGPGVEIGRKSGLMQFDGYSNSLKIRRVTASGFSGSWSAGVFADSEFGYFCARRTD